MVNIVQILFDVLSVVVAIYNAIYAILFLLEIVTITRHPSSRDQQRDRSFWKIREILPGK